MVKLLEGTFFCSFCWSGRRIRMSTLKKENHIIDVIDYHIIYIYIYIIYTYFTSSQFFQLSKHPMLWTTKSFRRHFWGIRFVAASSGEYRRSCLGSCYKMLKHTSEENMNWLCQRHILVDIYHIYICNYIYIYHITYNISTTCKQYVWYVDIYNCDVPTLQQTPSARWSLKHLWKPSAKLMPRQGDGRIPAPQGWLKPLSKNRIIMGL